MTRLSLFLSLLLATAACGDDDSGPGDTGADASADVASDGSDTDASADVGEEDASSGDSSTGDMGSGDMGSGDMGSGDMGSGDMGSGDMGSGDATTDGGTDGGTDASDGGTDASDGSTDVGPGGACRSNGDCGRSQYCAGEDCESEGRCLPRPLRCPDVFMPVCGCDGEDYGNECEAASEGARVASRGMCSSSMECAARPPPSCCYDDGDCAFGLRTRCARSSCEPLRAGTCVTARVPRGQCWEDSDCDDGATCEGENICPCGVACFVEDSPGRCTE